MTKDADFKAKVREHMAATGRNYTAARAELLAAADVAAADVTADASFDGEAHEQAYAQAQREHELISGRFLRDGRLLSVPMKRKARAHVLLELVRLFEPGRPYAEPEVNGLLGAVDEDYAFWRRELVNYGYLEREAGVYRLPARPPVRSGVLVQELPAWEALWLPGHLAGHTQGSPDLTVS